METLANPGGELAGPDDTAVIVGGTEPVDLIVLFGQSNAAGRADVDNVTIRSGYDDPYPAITLKRRQAVTTSNPLVWSSDETVALQARTDSATENMGPELSMGRKLDEIAPGRFAIVQTAIGGAGLEDHLKESSTYPDQDDDNAFAQTVAFIEEAMTELNGTVVAFVWVQGETDALYSPEATAYETNLTQFIADMRAANAAWADVPFIFNRLTLNSTAPQRDTVRAAQVAVAAADSTTFMVGCDDLAVADGFHFSADGYVLLGERLALAALEMAGVTRAPLIDATSNDSIPRSRLEWIHVIEAAGLVPYADFDPPWDTLMLDAASGNLIGEHGMLILQPNATAPLYQQALSGWSAYAIGFADNTANQRFRTGQITWANPSTEDIAVFMRPAVTNTPAAARGVVGIGTTNDVSVRAVNSSGVKTRILAGNVVTSSNNMGTAVRPWWVVVKRSSTTTLFYSDQEKLTPTWSNVSGIQLDIGAAGGVNPPDLSIVPPLAVWRGASVVKFTDAKVKAITQALGHTVTGY